MVELIINFFDSWPHWLATMLLSGLPLTELRLTIPLAIHSWNINPMDAYGLAVLGTLIPFFPIFFGLRALRDFCSKHFPKLVAPIDRLLVHGEHRLKKQYERYGAIALFLLASIPLPLAGLWSSALVAVALKIPFRKAFLAIGLGTLVAGLLVTLISAGANAWF